MAITSLPKDWAYAPALDAELKRYQLLAYVQRVEGCFAERKLYPHLADLDGHILEMRGISAELGRMQRALGGAITGFDAATGQPVREAPPPDSWLLVVEEVIGMALPVIQQLQGDGQALRAEIAHGIRFAPVGLLPLDASAGWLLLRSGRDASVYGFELPRVSGRPTDDAVARLRTHYVSTFTMGIATTFERIKGELLVQHPELPNPAVFAFETSQSLPRIETYMPVAKQLLCEAIRPAA